MSCCAGKVLCLHVLIEGGCPLDDDVLNSAVNGGHLVCVDALLALGLPRKPLSFSSSAWDPSRAGRIRDEELRCLEHLIDAGYPIHSETLICAATGGDLDLVRFLHSRGVQLWDSAAEAIGPERGRMKDFSYGPPDMWDKYVKRNEKTISEPLAGCDHMWKPLWYGWGLGAPLTPAMEKVVTARRVTTRATLLCFGLAARLSRGEGGPPEHRAAWAAMGRMPRELLEKILLLADCEIPESLRRGLPATRRVRVQWDDPPQVVWMSKKRKMSSS
jgi:hypothetical protein